MTVNLGTITTEAQLDAAIRSADTQTVADNYIITFGSDVTEGNITIVQNKGTLLADLAAINLKAGVTLTINGGGHTLIGTNGTNTFRGLFAYGGNVAINNLTIKNAVAKGGAGGSSPNQAGGGGAGLGGGLFVGNTATVTLNQVYFANNKAVGGAGGTDISGGASTYNVAFYAGGGGMGGAGGSSTVGGYNGGGGGGIGRTANGASYNASGSTAAGAGSILNGASGGAGASTVKSSSGGATGGGGGYGVTNTTKAPFQGGGGGGGGVGGAVGVTTGGGTGGAGGFGGGGGGGYTTGGKGGFGGGGGGGFSSGGAGGWGGGGASNAALGGFGGGTGGGTAGHLSGGGGGGGMGAGGDIFVYKGGSLIIQSGTLSGGGVTGGIGGTATKGGGTITPTAGLAGSAFATGIFIYGSNKTVTLSPALGQSLTISDVIADQKGVGNGTNVGNILVGDKGTVILSKANQFSGNSSIQNGGTLELNASGAAGTSIITFGTGFGKLQIQSAALTNGGTFSNTVNNFIAGDVMDMTGLTFVSGASATVSAGVLKVISNSVTNSVSLTSSATGFAVIKDAGTGSNIIANTFTIATSTDLTKDLVAINTGGIDSFANVGYTFNFISSFAIASTQTIALGTGSSLTFNGGKATTGGGYEIAAGTLIGGAAGAIGSGAITVDAGATLDLSTFNETIGNLTGAGAITLGTGTLTEGTTSSTTFSGVISGTGGVVKQGSGTLTLTGTNTPGSLTINAGRVRIGNGGTIGSLSGNIVDNNALEINETGTVTLAGSISGTGTLFQSGSGVTILNSATNTFSGGETVTGGVLRLGASGAGGTGALSLSSGTTFDLNSFNQTISNLTGLGTITLGTGTLTAGTTASSTFSGAISGAGVLVKQGTGTLTLSAANTFGALMINAGKIVLGAAGAGGASKISFGAGTGDILSFTSAAAPMTPTLFGMVAGQTLALTGQTIVATDIVNNNTLQIGLATGGPINITLDSSVSYAGDFFHFTNNGADSFITENTTPCYLAGTKILTDRGEVPVETLAIGDSVITLGGSAKPVKWIGRRAYTSAFAAGNRDVVPILIKAGALADNVPARDLFVSPLHAMFVDDVLIPAEHLVNGVSIVRCPEIDPIRYFHIELDRHDVIFAEGAPAETFVDCDSRGMFHNALEFATLYPGDSPLQWAFCAPRVESGPVLEQARRIIEARAGLAPVATENARQGPLQGRLDGIDGTTITGWAFDPDRPAVPVTLDVLDGDGLIARVIANRYRSDLEASGIGDGRHGFELRLARGLSPLSRHRIRVRRTGDDTELVGSPLVLEARDSEASLTDTKLAIETAAWTATGVDELDALLTTVLQGAADVRRLRSERLRATERDVRLLVRADRNPLATKRALVIDDAVPRSDRDAGSNAIFGHIAALQALGWYVEFVASRELTQSNEVVAELEARSVTVHRAPYVASVEEVFRRHRNTFGLVYLHRLSNAEAYATLARTWQPKARLIYSLADLHHVRLARQATVQANPELMAESHVVRQREIAVMRQCDAVITHSTAEASYLGHLVPGAAVHVVPWALSPIPRRGTVSARHGIAFIGGYHHAPNIDAVRWLADEIMPLVWTARPHIGCMIIGSNWPARLSWVTDNRLKLIGKVDHLDGVFETIRATVAPLRFGAGLKGKVLDSLAAGIPCAMTSIAAEGIPLAGRLAELVMDEAASIARAICTLHVDTGLHRTYADAGLAMVDSRFSMDIVTRAMEDCVLGRIRAANVFPTSDRGFNAAPVSSAVAA
jgi:hypothetical protein